MHTYHDVDERLHCVQPKVLHDVVGGEGVTFQFRVIRTLKFEVVEEDTSHCRETIVVRIDVEQPDIPVVSEWAGGQGTVVSDTCGITCGVHMCFGYTYVLAITCLRGQWI